MSNITGSFFDKTKKTAVKSDDVKTEPSPEQDDSEIMREKHSADVDHPDVSASEEVPAPVSSGLSDSEELPEEFCAVNSVTDTDTVGTDTVGTDTDEEPPEDRELSGEAVSVETAEEKTETSGGGDDLPEDVSEEEQQRAGLWTADNQKLRSIVILLVILAVFGLIYSHLMSPEHWTLRMKMKGSAELTLYQGDKYVEKGCTAKCSNDLTGAVRVLSVSKDGEVNTKKTGTYTITYTAKYLGKKVHKKRTVTIVDNVVDARKVSMYDTFSSGDTAPVIGLYGGSRLIVYDVFGYRDSYVATDDAEGYITDRVKVTGQVDTSVPGKYKLGYEVTDEDGQTTTAERQVTVEKFLTPELRELKPDEKIIYLTFDDGPGKYTDQILSILDKYQVKATFFVTATDRNYLDLIRKEAEHGHAVGVHTYTHKYDQIYSNDQAFWDDFNAMNDIIEEQTGRKTNIMRFPGGSSNTVSKKYCSGIMTRLASEATSQGYWFFDWNVMSGDAGDTRDTATIVENMKSGVLEYGRSVVLCHDTHEYTMNAIEPFLQWALSCGYSFDSLQYGYYSAHQSINN